MAVDGALIVLDVSPVMGEARGRSAADLGEPNIRVSCKMTAAGDALAILHEKNRTNPAGVNRRLYRLLYTPSLYVMAYERLKSTMERVWPPFGSACNLRTL